MELHVTVHLGERYTVYFQHDRFWVNVDHRQRATVLAQDKPFQLGLSRFKRHLIPIGSTGQHQALIEMERKLLLGGLRPMQYRVYVDGHLTHVQAG